MKYFCKACKKEWEGPEKSHPLELIRCPDCDSNVSFEEKVKEAQTEEDRKRLELHEHPPLEETKKLPSDVVRSAELTKERGSVYGPYVLGHECLGKAFTAILEQFYGIKLPREIPGYIAALMITQMKILRMSHNGPFHKDNYDDAHNYMRFAEEMQEKGATS